MVANDRITIEYRRHTIIARKTDASWDGRAFRGKKPATEIRSAGTSDDVVVTIQADLDFAAAEERAARGPDGFPGTQHIRTALGQLSLSDGQRAMLDAHLDAPNHILTATQLSAAAGKDGHEYANLQYGLLARALAEEMDYTPAERRADGSTIWTFALATGIDPGLAADAEATPEWRWKLRHEIVEALRAQ